MDISIRTPENHSSVELILNGDLDASEALSLADRMLNLIPLVCPSKVLINLANCPQVCNQALAALVTFSLSPQLEGCTLHLLGLTQSLTERMLGLNLDRLFTLEA